MIKKRMPCLYKTQKDLYDRLNGSICMYDDEPVEVIVSNKGEINIVDMVSRSSRGTIKPEDPKFDIASIELGYSNLYYQDRNFQKVGSVQYAIRNVAKRYRQGICSHSVSFFDINGNDAGSYSIGANYGWNNPGFKESLMNEFPSINEGLEILERGFINKDYKGLKSEFKTSQIAVSKMIALEKTGVGVILVYMKTKNIGWIAPKENIVHIPDSSLSWIITRYMHGFQFRVE